MMRGAFTLDFVDRSSQNIGITMLELNSRVHTVATNWKEIKFWGLFQVLSTPWKI